MRGVPDARHEIFTADGDEAAIWLRGGDDPAVVAHRRRAPAMVRRGRVPDPGGAVQRRADDAARARVEVRDQDVRRPFEHGVRHPLASIRYDDGPGGTGGEHAPGSPVELDRGDL